MREFIDVFIIDNSRNELVINFDRKFVFLDMGKIKSAKVNYSIPGDPMDQQEFEQMIKKAEMGPFHSMKTVRNELAKWKAKYSK